MSERTVLIGITTSPRPERYLLATIRSAKAASVQARARFVIAPNFIDPGEDWDAVRHEIGDDGVILDPLVKSTVRELVESRSDCANFHLGNDIYASEACHRGIQHNTDRMIRHLLGMGAENFVTLQDDVIFCKRAIDRIWVIGKLVLPRGSPAPGAVSFYSPHHDCGRSRRALWLYQPDRFYGELCVLWKPKCAEDFLTMSNPSNAHDLEIQRFFLERYGKWRLWGHSPCLVQHVGHASARGAESKGMVRESPNFNAEHDAVQNAKAL